VSGHAASEEQSAVSATTIVRDADPIEMSSVDEATPGALSASGRGPAERTPASGPAIELVAISKRYGATQALESVDLEIADGEFLVLLGPSGCGKSTLLKIIAGLEDPSDGEVYIGGRLANYLRPGERDVAMVFQNYALYPHMTVETNLGFPLKMRKRPRAEVAQRVREVAALLELGDQLAKYPDQLSGGQRQRVALGRAIIREPVAFLMDEPLSNLDALLRVQMRTELLRLHRRVGRTTVYVTHDQVEAMTMADRIVVLRDGVVQQLGTTAQVYGQPANRFVATFVGSPPMNLFGGRLASRDGELRFEGAVSLRLAGGTRATDGEVTLGVRPETIELVGPGEGDAGGVVDLVESVGADQFVAVRLEGGAGATVRVDAEHAVREGDRVRLRFSPGAVHLFDAAGNRVSPGVTPA
jgi:ABC-type sugar transport system ATPase subunit